MSTRTSGRGGVPRSPPPSVPSTYQHVAAMGRGVVDEAALEAPWFLQGGFANVSTARKALRSAPVGGFVMWQPRGHGGPRWKFVLLVKVSGGLLHHYTVVNGMYGFALKFSDVAMPSLSEFVAYYSKHPSRDLPVKLRPAKAAVPVEKATMARPVVTSRGIADGVDGIDARRLPRKRALLIAISYHGKVSKQGHDLFLPGALHDHHRVKTALTEKFDFVDVCTISEADSIRDMDGLPIADSPTGGPPTRANILAGFDWLIRGAQSGDQLFMHLAGHGSHIKDDDGDEADGLDEVLVPLDYSPSFDTSKLVRDDEIFKHLIQPLAVGATLNFVIDTCHSGSLTDLQWMWDGARFTQGSTRASRGGLAVCLSGCCDDEESTDASSFDGTSHGVLTHSWLQAIEEGNLTYQSMFDRTCEIMSAELARLRAATGLQLKQNPRISFTRKCALSDGFFALRSRASLTNLPLPSRERTSSEGAPPHISTASRAVNGSSTSARVQPPTVSGTRGGDKPSDGPSAWDRLLALRSQRMPAAASSGERPDLADPKLVHKLSFLRDSGNDATLEVLLEGLGEGWLSVADLLYSADPAATPSRDAAASPQPETTKVDWRDIGRAAQTTSAARDDTPRRMRHKRRHRSKRADAAVVPPMCPDIHVHINGVGGHQGYVQPSASVYTPHVDLTPQTTVVEEQVMTQEYTVNPDGTETVVRETPLMTTVNGRGVPVPQGAATTVSHHLDGTVVEEQTITHEFPLDEDGGWTSARMSPFDMAVSGLRLRSHVSDPMVIDAPDLLAPRAR